MYINLNLKKHTLGVAVDFKKAFDAVNHEILLRKLTEYGVRGVALEWIRSYLHGRTQCVRIGNVVCKERLISYGVPQGSVLLPFYSVYTSMI